MPSLADTTDEIRIDEMSKSQLLDLMAECSKDSKLFAKVLFPEDFYKPFAKQHDKIFDLLDNSDNPKKVIAAPRGIGKSMIANLVVKGDILFHRKHFVGYLSDSLTKAEMETENIKSSLVSSVLIRKLFPPITLNYYNARSDDSFSKKAWVAYGNTFVMPRGAGQQVNGLRWLRYRPDRWIIDDFEDVTEVFNESQRAKKREWFFGALMNTVSRYDKNYDFFYIDTIKHQDALIVELLNDKNWDSVHLSVCDDDYKTLMPEFLPQSELDEVVKDHREKKLMDLFAMNFMSQAVSQEDKSFSMMFRYYSETDLEFQSRLSKMITVLVVDPAKTKKMHNAQSGIVVCSFDYERQAYYIRYAHGDFFHPDELINRALELADRYSVDAIGVELTGLEEWGSYAFKNVMFGRGGKIYPFEELKARGGRGEIGGANGKIGRVNFGLLPLYERGLVYHNEVGVGALEAQELGFPRPERWDVLDAAAYIPSMFEKIMLYIDPMGTDGYPDEREIEKEYEGLYDEPAFRWERV